MAAPQALAKRGDFKRYVTLDVSRRGKRRVVVPIQIHPHVLILHLGRKDGREQDGINRKT